MVMSTSGTSLASCETGWSTTSTHAHCLPEMDPETIDQTLRHRTSTGQDQEPPNEEPQQGQGQPSPAEPDAEEQTCRICLTGTDPDLGVLSFLTCTNADEAYSAWTGPLLSPCLCRGEASGCCAGAVDLREADNAFMPRHAV